MKHFLKMIRDDSGAAAAEYALILAIVGTAIAAAAINLGGKISTAMNTAGTCVETPSTCSAGSAGTGGTGGTPAG